MGKGKQVDQSQIRVAITWWAPTNHMMGITLDKIASICIAFPFYYKRVEGSSTAMWASYEIQKKQEKHSSGWFLSIVGEGWSLLILDMQDAVGAHFFLGEAQVSTISIWKPIFKRTSRLLHKPSRDHLRWIPTVTRKRVACKHRPRG